MPSKSFYDKSLKTFARELRNDSTLEEVILWSKVLKTKGTGYQFNRQFLLKISEEQSIIVDFICRKLKLVIEIDGSSHNYKVEEDIIRDKYLKNLGFFVLRLTKKEVQYNIDTVVKSIEDVIKSIEDHSLFPSLPLSPKGDLRT